MKIINRHGNELEIEPSQWHIWRLRGAKQVKSAGKAKGKSAQNGSESAVWEDSTKS